MPLSLLLAYMVGSIPFALLLARRWGTRDLRRTGSGNLGAANVMRTSGLTPALLVLLLDVSKGAAGVMIAEQLTGSAAAATAAAGVAVIVGHIYPVWLGFRGGKGVATACGAFVILAPTATALAIAVFVVCVWRTRYVSLGSVLATASLPPAAYAAGQPGSVIVAGLASAALIVFRHRDNLVRLAAGTERRFTRARTA